MSQGNAPLATWVEENSVCGPICLYMLIAVLFMLHCLHILFPFGKYSEYIGIYPVPIVWNIFGIYPVPIWNIFVESECEHN